MRYGIHYVIGNGETLSNSARKTVESVYERYSLSLRTRAFMILGNSASAEEVVQETFVKTIVEINRGRMDINTISLAWLYKVCTNICLNFKRKHGKIVLSDDYISECKNEFRDVELTITVNNLLNEMPKKLREIAIYKYIDEMTAEEIVELTGISRRTMFRQLDKIKTWISKKAPDLIAISMALFLFGICINYIMPRA